MRKLLQWIFSLDLALWFGGGVYFSAMAAEELSNQLSLSQFGHVIGILFPPFFTLMAITAVIGSILYIVIGRSSGMHSKSYTVGLWLVLFGALAALVNWLILLPKVQHIEQAIGPLASASSAELQQFGMWHGLSLGLHFLEMAAVALVWLCFSLNTSTTGRKSA
ncbi:DUF4149 domain-containing protein [Alicyclobacillus sp. ALC3]|uniref:DUF4149 domain-containing protein n=1 Tax=Alicyclobacillus sp. ALC3 TaxID=2796143 RepID=UPI002379263B|nr:DUF4149 domain-containing protein [Alicyclobacillus sp. ALC3]WDL97960.1 DUF4149 domain-containing protein [Alicyclobacillus sp. ALC3]